MSNPFHSISKFPSFFQTWPRSIRTEEVPSTAVHPISNSFTHSFFSCSHCLLRVAVPLQVLKLAVKLACLPVSRASSTLRPWSQRISPPVRRQLSDDSYFFCLLQGPSFTSCKILLTSSSPSSFSDCSPSSTLFLLDFQFFRICMHLRKRTVSHTCSIHSENHFQNHYERSARKCVSKAMKTS